MEENMKKTGKVYGYWAGGLLVAFALWTALVCTVDVQAIGPNGSCVGLASVNAFFHELTGGHMSLYVWTDWLSLVPVGFGAGFALLGLGQWIRRRSRRGVDGSIWLLGGFYLAVAAAFLLFEVFVVNYRPILIDGRLEASYPSSTTMLALCVMPTAQMQLRGRIQNHTLRKWVSSTISIFTGFMVVGRLLSGVHWFTDIVGGILLSAGLVLLYYSAVSFLHKKTDL